MKKLYIGLGVSFALIIGGIIYGSLARPTVDMTKLSNIFYNQQDHYEIPNNNKMDFKLISVDENNLKMQIDFKDYSGTEDLVQLMNGIIYDGSPLSESDKKKVENFYKGINEGRGPGKKGGQTIYTKHEKLTYRWLDTPFNMSLAKVNYKVFKRKNGATDSYEVFNVLQENGKVALSGEIESKKAEDRPRLERLRINGIRGKGILEIDYRATY